jgi:formylglycine-generating enzyme required for sulfatase activity
MQRIRASRRVASRSHEVRCLRGRGGPVRFCGFALVLLGAIGMNSAHAQSYPTSPLQPVAGIFPQIRDARPLSPLEQGALVPHDHFKECDSCPEMVVIPPGDFLMGSPQSEEGSDPDERPQHRVVISRPFAAGRFAVTFDEWDACVAARGCRNYLPADRGWGRGLRPVINVRWEDARAYVAWLSQKTGQPYRLLSEAEREYVTRAGTTTPFWWGSSISSRQANYDGKFPYPSDAKEKGGFRRETVPVGSFDPNPWGLYQVHGNVYEWVEDCWYANYEEAPTDGSARTMPDCAEHVLRGGSWNFAPWHLRSAARGRLAAAAFASGGVVGIGLRVARTLSRR